MQQVISIEDTIAEKIKNLPPEQKQQVLDFVEFLLSKTSKKKEFKHPDGRPMSALEAAGDLVGCLDGGPGDLSTNKKYLEGPMSALKAAGDLVGSVEGPGDLSMRKRELKRS
ncbi:MAG: DUF2281 domain-containing protein, partial [Okeania sp. SIO2H7]|nr:DUF2281 domain-containing protein [Okeania sp. SIO2H7]